MYGETQGWTYINYDPQGIMMPYLNWGNFDKLRKGLVNHKEFIESNEWQRIWVLQILKTEIKKAVPNHSAVLSDSAVQDILINWETGCWTM